jgi:ABC-2 type transport system permease protein
VNGRDVVTVWRHEVRSYLVSPIPYLFTFVFVMFTGLWTFVLAGLLGRDFFFVGRADLELNLFDAFPWALAIFVPALSMRLWSEERLQGTVESLLTLPVSTASVVTGKFMAASTLLVFLLLATFGMPITASALGDLDWGATMAGYFGALLVGASLLALGLFYSAVTRHQLVAYILTCFTGLFLVGLAYAARETGVFAGLAERVSLLSRYYSMGRGVIDLRDVAYFAGFVLFFLYLNVRVIENRRHAS